LPNCEHTYVKKELEISNEKLADWLKKDVEYFAYPNGSYCARDVDIIKEFNYRLAFMNDPHYLTPQKLKNIYEIPRFGYLDGASFAENICRITGVWFFNTKSIFKK
jgi:predicted Rossmann fold nucleotide-binding protein DprA/Smf involved in DNA uptake